MSLVRYEPFRSLSESFFPEFEGVARRMNRLFAGMWPAPWEPPVDIAENEEEIVLRAELPGMDPKGVKVEVKGDVLTISGERKWEEEKKEENYYRVERSYGKFSRSFVLSDSVDKGKISARYEKGILTLRVPRSQKALPHTVEVKVG